ncbi:hypothetical protein GCM10022277_33300 [Litoribacillus peritrichatus]|uniref:Amine oxidase domain-containing protein n=2 Tax=Litoribacillus peritrichatus TaxID=718191 RepID=A0ABP7N2I0_9GAMM
MNCDVAVIGAGLSGLVAAKRLQDEGLRVACFEKARGSGGRLSSKRLVTEQGLNISFDLGCSAVTATTDVFKKQLETWAEDHVVSPWLSVGEALPQYVGVPRNSSITRNLVDQLNVSFGVKVTRVSREGDRWVCYQNMGDELVPVSSSKYLIISAPPEQTFDLLPIDNSLRSLVSKSRSLPQWVLMIATDTSRGDKFRSLSPMSFPSSVSGMSLESSKPNRETPEHINVWQVQASTDWSRQRTDWLPDAVAKSLIADLETTIGESVHVIATYVHRWLYSVHREVNQASEQGYLWGDDGIGLCGDYLAMGLSEFGLEAAYLSGSKLGEKLCSL